MKQAAKENPPAPEKVVVAKPQLASAKVAVSDHHAEQISEQDIKAEEENPTPDQTQTNAAGEKAKQDQMHGELYLASLDVDEPDKATNEIKDKIVALGGEKARKVDLGWRRKEDESYFHFTVPESNLAPLMEFLKSFGPVRISKQKHPVVMPQGKIRIILVVKENADNADDQAPSP